jgi:hypothetical protein
MNRSVLFSAIFPVDVIREGVRAVLPPRRRFVRGHGAVFEAASTAGNEIMN